MILLDTRVGRIHADGSNSEPILPDVHAFTASGTITVPAGKHQFRGTVQGPGGDSGAQTVGSGAGGDGGAGSRLRAVSPCTPLEDLDYFVTADATWICRGSEILLIAAGGGHGATKGDSDTPGNAGGGDCNGEDATSGVRGGNISDGIIPGRGPGAAQDGTSASGADAGEGGTPSANTSTGGKGGGGKFGGGAGASSASNGAGGGAGGLSWAHPDAEFVDLVKGEGTIPGGINDDNYIAGKGEGAVGSTTGTPNTGTLGYVIFEF